MNRRARLFLPVILILAGALVVCAADPIIEYGAPSELRGLTRIFIDTGTNLETRNVIAAEIHKKLPALTIVERIEAAQVVLDFTGETHVYRDPGGGTVYFGTGTQSPSYYGVDVTAPSSTTEHTGHGLVYLPVSADAIRVVLEHNDLKGTFSKKGPAKKFAKKFIKAYRTANRK